MTSAEEYFGKMEDDCEGSEGEGQPWLAEVTTGILIFKGLLLLYVILALI